MSAQAMTFPSSRLGLPKELQYSLEPQMPAARSYPVTVSPDGITVVAGPLTTQPSFVLNSTGFNNQQFSSQTLQFTIPAAGSSPSVFLDTTATSLSFRLAVTVGTAIAVGTATNLTSNLIGSAASFFSSLQLVSNNVPLESIASYGELCNMLINSLSNVSQRTASLNFAGCDTNTNSGIDIGIQGAAASVQYYHFTIPLMSIIGQSATQKWFPVGMISNLQLQMQTSATLPIVTSCSTAAPTTLPTITPVLDQFQLNLRYIDIGSAASAVMSSAVGGKLYIKSSTYTNSNQTVPIGTLGSTSVALQIRQSSLKSLFWYQALAQTAATPNGTFDGVNNGSLTRAMLTIGGNRYTDLNPSNRPSQALHQLQQALGLAGDWNTFGGIITRVSYGATVPSAIAAADNSIVVPANNSRPAPTGSNESAQQVTQFPSTHYLGQDLESSNGVLFSGVNTRSQPPQLDLVAGVATTGAATLLSWGLADCVLEVDIASKSIVNYI